MYILLTISLLTSKFRARGSSTVYWETIPNSKESLKVSIKLDWLEEKKVEKRSKIILGLFIFRRT